MRMTRSKDGRLRATVRVEHRVGLEDIVNLVCWSHRTWDDESTIDELKLSRSSVEQTVREGLKYHAESADYWRDDVPDEIADELEQKVTDEVLRLYPELG